MVFQVPICILYQPSIYAAILTDIFDEIFHFRTRQNKLGIWFFKTGGNLAKKKITEQIVFLCLFMFFTIQAPQSYSLVSILMLTHNWNEYNFIAKTFVSFLFCWTTLRCCAKHNDKSWSPPQRRPYHPSKTCPQVLARQQRIMSHFPAHFIWVCYKKNTIHYSNVRLSC